MDISCQFYLVLFQQIFLRSTVNGIDTCYYRNQSNIVPITCADECCVSTAMSPEAACCTRSSWGSFAIPVFVVGGVCFLTVCLIYLRPLLKACLCGCKCPCSHRFQVNTTPPNPTTTTDQAHVINNRDLPTYESIIKDSPLKDFTPPPYTFVTTHPNVFELEARVPSAPPQYSSRCNSAVTVRSSSSIDSSTH